MIEIEGLTKRYGDKTAVDGSLNWPDLGFTPAGVALDPGAGQARFPLPDLLAIGYS